MSTSVNRNSHQHYALLKYFADKYIDKRRTKEFESESRKKFRETASKMPDLIKEMQEDLSNPEFQLVRNFYIIPNSRIGFNPEGKVLYYDECIVSKESGQIQGYK